MKLSTKGRYGLRAIIDLARYSEEEPVSINNISIRQDISERYLEQLVALLKKAGLVKSIRGATGGYVLAKRAEEISVGDVLRALEGSLEPVKCAAFYSDEGCMASDGCVTKYVWQKINDSINKTVDEIMLDELVRESKMINPEGDCENPRCSDNQDGAGGSGGNAAIFYRKVWKPIQRLWICRGEQGSNQPAEGCYRASAGG